MKKLLYLFLLLPLLMVGCKKQSAGSDTNAEVVFNLSFDRALAAHQTINVDTKAEGVTFRNIICVYKMDATGSVISQEKPDYSFSWEGEKTTYTGSLPVGKYRVLAWSDHKGGSSLYWDASDFTSIKMDGTHQGSDENVRAFKGDVVLDVTDNGNRALSIPMASPMGKFVVLSTEAQQAALNGLKVRFTYSQFMPSAFGMFHDKPVDSKSGVSFTSTPEEGPEGTVQLGYDYVLTNGAESTVPMLMEILSGSEVASFFTFNIPLVRGKITTVKGEFLSGGSQAAITIDTEFEGSFTVEI